MPTERKRWKLCNSHCSCPTCKKAIKSWKDKANISGWNASRLKYALMCVLNNEIETLFEENGDDTPLILPTIILDIAVPTEEDSLNFSCGICMEKCYKIGINQPIIFGCSHSICATCYNNENFRKKKECPFCRAEITKSIKLIIS